MFGEVFICQFPFTSGATSKLRPALALFDLSQDAIVCRITSVLHAGPLDVPVTDSGDMNWETSVKPRVLLAPTKVEKYRSAVSTIEEIATGLP